MTDRIFDKELIEQSSTLYMRGKDKRGRKKALSDIIFLAQEVNPKSRFIIYTEDDLCTKLHFKYKDAMLGTDFAACAKWNPLNEISAGKDSLVVANGIFTHVATSGKAAKLEAEARRILANILKCSNGVDPLTIEDLRDICRSGKTTKEVFARFDIAPTYGDKVSRCALNAAFSCLNIFWENDDMLADNNFSVAQWFAGGSRKMFLVNKRGRERYKDYFTPLLNVICKDILDRDRKDIWLIIDCVEALGNMPYLWQLYTSPLLKKNNVHIVISVENNYTLLRNHGQDLKKFLYENSETKIKFIKATKEDREKGNIVYAVANKSGQTEYICRPMWQRSLLSLSDFERRCESLTDNDFAVSVVKDAVFVIKDVKDEEYELYNSN